MEPPHYITVALPKADAEKLAALASDATRPLVIQLQYTDRGPCGHVIDKTSVEREIYILLGKRNHLESQIANLQRRIKQLGVEYTRLVAQMQAATQSTVRHVCHLYH